MFKTVCTASNIPFDEVCHQVSSRVHPDTMKPKPKNKKSKHVIKTNFILFYKYYLENNNLNNTRHIGHQKI